MLSLQCANIAPSSFKMLEHSGRFRTYSQSNDPSVENAVMVRSCYSVPWSFRRGIVLIFILPWKRIARPVP